MAALVTQSRNLEISKFEDIPRQPSGDRPTRGGRFPAPLAHTSRTAARAGTLGDGWHALAATASGRYGPYMHLWPARGPADGARWRRRGDTDTYGSETSGAG